MAQFFTPLDTQSFDSLARLMMERREEERKRPLRDIQLQEAQLRLADLQRNQAQDAELRNRLSEVGPRTVTSVAPAAPSLDVGAIPGGQYLPSERISDPQPMSLGDLMPGSARLRIQQPEPFRMQQPQASPLVQAYHDGRVSTKTEQPNYGQIAYETRMKQGRMEDALKAISMDDKLAEYGAKMQASGGDLRQYYAAKQELDTAKAFIDDLAGFAKHPELMKIGWPLLVKAYPKKVTDGVSPDMVKFDEKLGVLFPMTDPQNNPIPGMYHYKDPADGKMHVKEITDRKGFDTIDLGDKVEVVPRDGSPSTFKKKGVSPNTQVKVNVGGGNKDFRDESAMRKEFLNLPEVKDFPSIEQNNKRALAALNEQGKGSNVAVDQTVITVLNKMLDPSSVVRESEYARTPQDLSVISRIKGKWDKIKNGGAGLDPTERQSLYRMIQNFNEIANQQYNAQVDFYSDLAQRYGYDPRNVVRLGGAKATMPGEGTPSSAPKPGQVVKGYRFKGGNPADKNNWVKI